MSQITLQSLLSKTIVALILIMFIGFSSCARKVMFDISTIVPAADGKVKVKKDKNNNYAVKIEVSNLAEPNRLAQPKSVYVVWMETESNGMQNLGQLKTSSGLFSNNLKASLEAVTPYKPIRLFITGEDVANIQYPSNYVILNTTSF